MAEELPAENRPDGGTDKRSFGEYDSLEKIGAGGMGVVYRARQRSADRVVALKLIRPERLEGHTPAGRQEWLDRFQAEAQATARLEHDNVVTIYEVGLHEGTPYFSMRLIDGQSPGGDGP